MRSALTAGLVLAAGVAAATPDAELGIQSVCRSILAKLSVHDLAVESIQADAATLFPNDAVDRAIQIGASGKLGEKMVPTHFIGSRKVMAGGYSSPKRITTDAMLVAGDVGSPLGAVRVVPNDKLNTLQFASVRDVDRQTEIAVKATYVGAPVDLSFSPYRPHPSTEVVASWFAGMTTINSHAARVQKILDVMNAPSAQLAPNGLLENEANWVDVSAVSADVPYHGTGPIAPEFDQLPRSLDWRAEYYQELKSFGLPLVAGGRSSECMLMGQLAVEHPELFQGMVWLGPTHPTAGFQEGLEGYEKVTDEYPPFINAASFKHMMALRNQLAEVKNPWWEAAEWKTPLLIIVGSEDVEVSQPAREAFRALAKRFPDKIFYVEIPGSAHDPFSMSGNVNGTSKASADGAAKQRAKIAWDYTYWFINKYVKGQADAPLPPHGLL